MYMFVVFISYFYYKGYSAVCQFIVSVVFRLFTALDLSYNVIKDNFFVVCRKEFSMEAKSPSLRKNPSRETCEGIIRRILMTEVLEKGKNEHFRTAADFMKYFESLYPASDALTKQVQRAIRSLNMPKDELGYFIPNKTAEQLAHEQELTYILKKANADVCRMDDYQPLFLKADDAVSSYMLSRITDSPLFQGKYLTAHTVSGGILFYTKNPNQLEILLKSLIVR